MTKTRSELMEMYASVVSDVKKIIKYCPPHTMTVDNSMGVVEHLARDLCKNDEEVVFIDEAFPPFVFESIQKMVAQMIELKQETHLRGLECWLSMSRYDIEIVEIFCCYGIQSPRIKHYYKDTLEHDYRKAIPNKELLEHLTILESRLERSQDALEEAKVLYGISEQKDKK